MSVSTDELKARITAELPGVVEDLKRLVRIQSVSADPSRLSEVERSAELVRDLFVAEGVEARIVRAFDGAPPAIVGEKKGPEGAPTVLLYAHHDVQPENDPADWEQDDPFEPVERADAHGEVRLYGRGTADDKGGVIAHVAALRALGDDLPVTVRLFIEGEEEVASATLPQLLEQFKDDLKADTIVIADSGNWDIGVPALTTSLRGMIRMDIELRTMSHAVHSGMWGGLAPDGIMALIRLLNSLWNEDGSAAVEGLLSGPAADVDYPEDRLRAESGALAGTEWVGHGSAVERMWTQPAITVTGFDAPQVEGASNTLTPAARARITIRIAPGDTSANAAARLEEHLRKHTPWGATLTTTLLDTGEPIVLPASGTSYDAAHRAFTEAWDGTEPIAMGVGGSIPFIAEFLEAFPAASVLVTGVEDPDTRAHGANEGLHLAEFERVLLGEALLLRNLGA